MDRMNGRAASVLTSCFLLLCHGAEHEAFLLEIIFPLDEGCDPAVVQAGEDGGEAVVASLMLAGVPYKDLPRLFGNLLESFFQQLAGLRDFREVEEYRRVTLIVLGCKVIEVVFRVGAGNGNGLSVQNIIYLVDDGVKDFESIRLIVVLGVVFLCICHGLKVFCKVTRFCGLLQFFTAL